MNVELPSDPTLRELAVIFVPGAVGIAVGVFLGSTVAPSPAAAAAVTAACGVAGYLVGIGLYGLTGSDGE